jgi:hypothetical protein
VIAGEDQHPNAIGFTASDYPQLVDWAGRAVREGKRGAIPYDTPPLLSRLGLEPEGYIRHLRGHKEKPHPLVLGHVEKIKNAAQRLGQSFIKGLNEAKLLYST